MRKLFVVAVLAVSCFASISQESKGKNVVELALQSIQNKVLYQCGSNKGYDFYGGTDANGNAVSNEILRDRFVPGRRLIIVNGATKANVVADNPYIVKLILTLKTEDFKYYAHYDMLLSFSDVTPEKLYGVVVAGRDFKDRYFEIPEEGMTLDDVHCALGAARHVNSDLSMDQLVYAEDFYVYMDRKTGLVVNVQWSH